MMNSLTEHQREEKEIQVQVHKEESVENKDDEEELKKRSLLIVESCLLNSKF